MMMMMTVKQISSIQNKNTWPPQLIRTSTCQTKPCKNIAVCQFWAIILQLICNFSTKKNFMSSILSIFSFNKMQVVFNCVIINYEYAHCARANLSNSHENIIQCMSHVVNREYPCHGHDKTKEFEHGPTIFYGVYNLSNLVHFLNLK